MTNSIISNDVEETKGIDLSSVEESVENASNDEENLEVSSEFNPESKIISDESFNKYIEKIQTMNFIEVSKYVRDLHNELDTLSAAKENAEGILQLQKTIKESNDITKAIELADAEAKFEDDDVTSFLENYDDTVDKLNKICAAAEEKMHSFDGVKKTTSYITNEMLTIIDKNIDRINAKAAEGHDVKRMLQYYTSVRNIYSNRQDITWILDKAGNQKIVLKRLKDSLKKDKSNSALASTQKNVTKAFCKVFNVNQLTVFEKYLKNLFNHDDATFYTQYLLYLLYTSEKNYGKYGNHKHVEVLIMNVLEIASENYDLDKGSDYFDSQLLLLRDAVIEMLNLK